MTRYHNRQQRRATVLVDFADPEPAERLARRLILAGVGAEVWPAAEAQHLLTGQDPPLGPTVVVRRADHDHALALARLFDEVDRGTSAVAPPPRDLWHGPVHRRIFAALVMVALLAAIVALFVVAVG